MKRSTLLSSLGFFATLALPLAAAELTIVPAESELVVRVFKAGVGAGLAHDHVVRASEISGSIRYDPERPDDSAVSVEVSTHSLRVDEPEVRARYGLEENLSEKDRAKVLATMRSSKQLDVERFPTIRFDSTAVQSGPDEQSLLLGGHFTLHGVTREVTFPVALSVIDDSVRGEGSFRFRLSDHGIRPFSALLGAVRVADEIEMVVRLVARSSS